MSRLTRLVLLLSAAVALPLVGCGSSDAPVVNSGKLRVLDATVEVPPNPDVAAVRLVIDNGTATADELIGVTSSAAKDASVHRAKIDDQGRATMTPVAALPIPARSKVTLAPGGLHVMLDGLTEPLQAGTDIDLRLTFRHAGVRTTTVDVVPFGTTTDGPSHDMEH
ncbi:MAG: hypothetical protein JWM47_2509 [Acidimicrobiales bacterium]|nr:hypothetical protein [Acidimicrobiales bacterium]